MSATTAGWPGSTSPTDRHARFVEAGAGTGKTSLLVGRVVTLVAGDELSDPAGLAAITFTENAAAELRARLHAWLAAASADPGRPEPERARCAVFLRRLDDAAVTTIHGFAYRILATHPIEAGLPPGFGVESDVTSSLTFERRWSGLVDELFADPALDEIWRAGLALGLRLDALEAVARDLHARPDRLTGDPTAMPLPRPDLEPVVEPLRRALAWAPAAPAGDTLTAWLRQQLAPALTEIAEEPELWQALGVLTQLGGMATHGSAAAWQESDADRDALLRMLREARNARDALVTETTTSVLTTLLSRLSAFALAEADRRRIEGRLQPDDLLVLACRTLRDDPAVRAAVHARFTHVLVDEFQDTDPLQVELIHLVADPATPGWEQADVPPGRLFFVGDPAQSIYRFRRADVELYRAVAARHRAGTAYLGTNHRAVPAIVNVINAASARLMAEPGQVPYLPLVPRRDPLHGAGPPVLLLGGPQVDTPVDTVRTMEAEHLAGVVRRVRDEGWVVADLGAPDGLRAARFADVAVLLPTRTPLRHLEAALDDADIPYRVEARSLVWATDEVRDLLTILEAVDDPGDQVALVAALRHPGFACSDDDLLSWRVAGGHWSFFHEPPDGLADHPVAVAMAALRRYHDLRWWLPVNVLVERLVRERRLVEATTVHRRPRDRWRRLRFVVDQARAYADGGGWGLGGFVRWARLQAERGADAVETPLPEPDDDAVRILTVHAAKGLEFPVTVVAGLNTDDRVADTVLWPADDSSAGAEVKICRRFATPGYTAAADRERPREVAERVRVLHVALTRARDHLVVSLHHKARSDGRATTNAARLHGVLDALTAAGAVHEPSVPARTPPPPSTTAGRPAALDALPDHEAFVREREAVLARVRAAVPVSPSDLSHDVLPRRADVAPAPGEGRRLGSAVHQVLEQVDLAAWDHEHVDRLAAAAARAAGGPALAHAVAARVREALGSPVVREAARSRHWKEVPVVATVSGRYVEGYIDLLHESPAGLVVVDYKTDRVADDADLEAAAERYRLQLAAYAAALEAATGRTVTRAVLLFLSEAGAVARAVDLGPKPG